jgi:DNA-binding HxlR family transcriptional regulator
VKRSSVGHFPCSIARSLDIVGEWWTPLVLRDVFAGLRRFEEIQADLGIARNILSDRLSTLVERGVLHKHRYQESPDRYEYRLTEMGIDFYPVLAALMRWGDRWLADDGGPPVRLRHERCGQETELHFTCSQCGQELSAREVRAVHGPGARREEPFPSGRRPAAGDVPVEAAVPVPADSPLPGTAATSVPVASPVTAPAGAGAAAPAPPARAAEGRSDRREP